MSKLVAIVEKRKHHEVDSHGIGKSYEAYVEKHGRHFTKELAELALSEFIDKIDQVATEEYLKSQGVRTLNRSPDVAFLASRIKSLYREVVNSDSECINHAVLLIADDLAHHIFEQWAEKHDYLDWGKYI